ncbi:MAG: DUF4271 domain-containing protein [Flavobacteriales bacterium]
MHIFLIQPALKPLYAPPYSEEVLVMMLLGLISILTWIRVKTPNYLPDLFRSVLKRDYERYAFSNISYEARMPGILLVINYICAMTFFACITALNHKWTEFSTMDYSMYIYIVLAVLAYYLVKISLILLCGLLFEAMPVVKNQLFILMTFIKISGIILLPMLIAFLIVPYVPGTSIEIAGAGMLSLLFCARLLKTFQIARNNGISVSYIIVYLCTLEILPLVVLLKVFKDNTGGLTP